jgi:hypothetical protein
MVSSLKIAEIGKFSIAFLHGSNITVWNISQSYLILLPKKDYSLEYAIILSYVLDGISVDW